MVIKPQHRLYSCFFLFSAITGAFFSRLPDIQLAMHVNEAQLGLTLIGAAVGSLITMTFGSPVDRSGSGRAAPPTSPSSAPPPAM